MFALNRFGFKIR